MMRRYRNRYHLRSYRINGTVRPVIDVEGVFGRRRFFSRRGALRYGARVRRQFRDTRNKLYDYEVVRLT